MTDFEPVIGLEIHVQLKTNTKMFCGCRIAGTGRHCPQSVPQAPLAAGLDAPVNSSVCPVCTGQPGVLPVANKKAVELAVKAGLALNCRINERSVFARKNYFYPDLPKAYQISQYENPLCESGHIEIDLEKRKKKIRIKRAHLEEDAGKSLHAIGSRELDHTLLDFNRCGIPLLEIVSEPDMNSAAQACEYLAELKKLIQWIGASDCDMEKGELRADVNISLREKGSDGLGRKVEIKNLNSFKAIKDSITYEIARQAELLKTGEKITQDTRLWDEKEQKTFSMRSKETAHDYRYFPEPDLMPLDIDSRLIDKIRNETGELPQARKERFINELQLSPYDAQVLTSAKDISDYFEKCLKNKGEPKISANLITTELTGRLNAEKLAIKDSPIPPEYVAEISVYLKDSKISSKIAKEIIEKIWKNPQPPRKMIEDAGMLQVSDPAQIEQWAKEAIQENRKAAVDFTNGNEKALAALVGLVMKKSKGKSNPQMTNSILRQLLKK